MMHWLLLFALLSAPFWEIQAPRDWTEQQIEDLTHDSPWAQMAGPDPAVQIYLATARPMQDAESELARRRGKPLNEEYADYVRQDGRKHVILAIAYRDWSLLEDAGEARHMEEESVMKVGRQRYKIDGHFPPVESDPFLRLVFPRAVVPDREKTVTFELYVPGQGPYHEAEFRVREMLYKGKLEM